MKLTFDEVMEQIKIEKSKGKHSLQIKILQYEMFEGKRPKMLCQRLNSKDVEKQLVENGYTVSYKTTDKQVSTKEVKKVMVAKFRDLHTTNMIIKW